VTEPFDVAWLEKELNRSTRAVLWPGLILTAFFVAGTAVSVNRGLSTEWPAVVVLLLFAGLPGLWLLKIGLSPAATHPLLAAVRDDPSRIAGVSIEWRGGYLARIAVRLKNGRVFRMLAPKGREEELAAWFRDLAYDSVQ